MSEAWGHIFSAEKIREIQTEELSAIKELTLEQLSARIGNYQMATRDLALRYVKANEELHRRLSEKNSEELESMIERVPMAESTLRNRGGMPNVVKAKKPTFADKVQNNFKKEMRTNPEMRAFMESLKSGSK